jgi:hypothetical protein
MTKSEIGMSRCKYAPRLHETLIGVQPLVLVAASHQIFFGRVATLERKAIPTRTPNEITEMESGDGQAR